MSQDSSDSLIQQAKNGDHAAFIELMVRHEYIIQSVVRDFIRNVGGAYGEDDLVNEVILRAYQTMAEFRGDETAFQYFLRRTARGLCLNIIAKQGKEHQEAADLAISVHGRVVGPEKEYAAAEMQQCVQKAIGLLPEKFKELVLLKDIEGLGYEEIAAVLDVPLGTVQSRLNRGRAQLKTLLRELRCVEML